MAEIFEQFVFHFVMRVISELGISNLGGVVILVYYTTNKINFDYRRKT